jgi:DNA-binding XRE family transcriptional regulator
MSQSELALKAGIHLQSLGKIERGMTTKLNSKSQRGLAIALQVPGEYLDAVVHGTPISVSNSLKFFPHCWTPGTAPEEIWLSPVLNTVSCVVLLYVIVVLIAMSRLRL